MIEAPADLVEATIRALFALMRPSAPPPNEQGTELTMSQLRVLFRLRHGGPATMGEIARFADCSLQSATALIERVERRGLVTRDRREGDRRVVECRLTEPGRGLVDEIAGHRAATVRTALATLDGDELAQLHHLLLAMLDRQGRLPGHATVEPQPIPADAAAPTTPRTPASTRTA
ncbi:MAG: MarR family transcriptional regulator [Chloroflexota bacterium]